MRSFNKFEEKNLKYLVNHNVKFTQVEITSTGLKKSILDSTVPMRAYFLEQQFHCYEEQPKGKAFKQIKDAVILTESGEIRTQVSLYRPETKDGDPRMWIYRLGSYSRGNDIHVLIIHNDIMYSVNITRVDIELCCNSVLSTPLKELINEINCLCNSVSDELLAKFRSVSDQWFESEVLADTGIGRTVESFLGIKMNSERTPDYKGIELKSHREKRSSNKNVLFTQHPDWSISTMKSGRQIVDRFGYISNGVKTYQNTVQCARPNSQNLFLNVNEIKSLLELQAKKRVTEDVAAWQLVKLHERLLTKHHETFWIEVENRVHDDKEFFKYKMIEHTKNPNVGQFDVLIEQSIITLDMLLCRPSGHGDTFSFKIKKKGMPLLFPESIVYVLN